MTNSHTCQPTHQWIWKFQDNQAQQQQTSYFGRASCPMNSMCRKMLFEMQWFNFHELIPLNHRYENFNFKYLVVPAKKPRLGCVKITKKFGSPKTLWEKLKKGVFWRILSCWAQIWPWFGWKNSHFGDINIVVFGCPPLTLVSLWPARRGFCQGRCSSSDST